MSMLALLVRCQFRAPALKPHALYKSFEGRWSARSGGLFAVLLVFGQHFEFHQKRALRSGEIVIGNDVEESAPALLAHG